MGSWAMGGGIEEFGAAPRTRSPPRRGPPVGEKHGDTLL